MSAPRRRTQASQRSHLHPRIEVMGLENASNFRRLLREEQASSRIARVDLRINRLANQVYTHTHTHTPKNTRSNLSTNIKNHAIGSESMAKEKPWSQATCQRKQSKHVLDESRECVCKNTDIETWQIICERTSFLEQKKERQLEMSNHLRLKILQTASKYQKPRPCVTMYVSMTLTALSVCFRIFTPVK